MHRKIESQNDVGLEVIEKFLLFQPHCHGLGTFHIYLKKKAKPIVFLIVNLTLALENWKVIQD